tara:strand:+ start:603 stop:875 length:273 start_codon:yes stop_codon:yes gene_type:complete
MVLEITTQPTRSETLVTFTLNKVLIPPGTGKSFPNKESAQVDPIAKAIFDVKGVESVWILGNDIQVGKADGIRWSTIKSRVYDAIRKTCQ